MATGIAASPQYQHTMHRLEEAKLLNPQGNDYWRARDVHGIMGYLVWDKFVPVIEKAAAAITANGGDSSHHIAHTSKLMGVHGGGKRRVDEYFLSRGACYLIAMNGDPSKPEIAGAQAYFALQTRRLEVQESEAKDRKRVETRDRLTTSLKRVGEVAKDIGVERFGLFHDARYQGLYNMGAKAISELKGVPAGETLIDRAGPMELSAHEFQSNLAAEKLLNDGTTGEQNAISVNREVAAEVRALVIKKAGKAPEDFPLEPEPIKAVRKRLSKSAPARIASR